MANGAADRGVSGETMNASQQLFIASHGAESLFNA